MLLLLLFVVEGETSTIDFFILLVHKQWLNHYVESQELQLRISSLVPLNRYVSLRLRVHNAVSAQPCVGKFRISLVLLNFLHCNFRIWFETP